MEIDERSFISIDPKLRDRLKVQAAKVKKTMKEIIEELAVGYLESVGG